MAALIFTGPVSYFGVRKKPVTLGIGMITMGIGYLVFISPHFIADEYIPGRKLLMHPYSVHRCRLHGGLGARATTENCYWGGGAEPPLRNLKKACPLSRFSLISRVGIVSSSVFNE